MSWIGLYDLSRGAFNIRGLGVPEGAPGARPPAVPHEILPTGTLLIEVRHDADHTEPRPVLAYRRTRDWVREINVVITPAGEVSVAFRQGGARTRAAVDLPPGLPHDSRLRIAYSWDAPRRTGRLSVELIDDGRIFQAPVTDPVPMPVVEAKVLMRNGRATTLAHGVRYVAVSDEVEPVGLGGGLAAGTPVETPEGPVPVERLRLGDTVLTAASGPRPVRWVGRRTVPALGGFRPVRIRAPFFGLGRDLTVAPDQLVRLGVAEAEYMLGEDEVMIAAGHLVNGRSARRENRHRLVTYHQVLLDVHDCLLHDGLWSESLYVGALGLNPDLARSTVLADLPVTAIPRHRAYARHTLSTIEARSLAAALRA